MEKLIAEVKGQGDTVGGIITCVVKGCPVGLGEPEFGKLHAALGSAMLGINAVKGFEYGAGFACVNRRGSELNDVFTGGFHTTTNNSGGIQGGISNGEDIYFRVAFKPTPSIGVEQRTVNLRTEEDDTVSVEGRHDPCIVPRAVAVVEAMAALTVADQMMRGYRWN